MLFLCPVFLPLLKFVIGHIARYAPSSKFQNQQKYRSKLVNLFFHHYLKKYVWKRALGGWGARNPTRVLLSFLSVSSLPCARRRQSFPFSVVSSLIPVSESGSRFVRVCPQVRLRLLPCSLTEIGKGLRMLEFYWWKRKKPSQRDCDEMALIVNSGYGIEASSVCHLPHFLSAENAIFYVIAQAARFV